MNELARQRSRLHEMALAGGGAGGVQKTQNRTCREELVGGQFGIQGWGVAIGSCWTGGALARTWVRKHEPFSTQ